jgi:excisionase family DNA binding protein
MTADTIKDWFSIKEACEYLGISEPTMFRWMKAGKISYYKVGNSTRFQKHNLDMVAEKKVSDAEAELSVIKCAVCGNAGMMGGEIRSTGKVYFRLQKSKFFTLSDSLIGVNANVCPICGHIQLQADTDKLEKLMPEEE